MTKPAHRTPDFTAILQFPPGEASFLNTTTVCGTPLFPFRVPHFTNVTETLAVCLVGCLLSAHADCAKGVAPLAYSDGTADDCGKRGHESPCHHLREVDVGAVVSGWNGGQDVGSQDPRAVCG